jgi:N-acetylglucosaminyldiphosphoundecaprenol N-acetyl-beta-D-mannosaminyltransferase
VSRERMRILSVPIDAITYEGMLARVADFIAGERTYQICTVNPEFVMAARRDEDFMAALNRADLCLPDGVGILWAARRHGKPLQERVAGVDSVLRIAERAAGAGWRLYLLGAAPGVAERTAATLAGHYPGIQIVGTYAGTPGPQDEADILARVNASGADVLFVAYGAPEQDKWIARHAAHLNVHVAMGVGGAFDFISGVARRAPPWIQRLGLEWLHRLIREPWRWRRQMALPCFAWAVVRERSHKKSEGG